MAVFDKFRKRIGRAERDWIEDFILHYVPHFPNLLCPDFYSIIALCPLPRFPEQGVGTAMRRHGRGYLWESSPYIIGEISA